MRHPLPESGRPIGSRWKLALDQLASWIAAAVMAGALHLGLARALRLGFSVTRWGWESRDLVWRVPAGYLIVFLPVALTLAALALALGDRFPQRAAYAVWISLVLFALLLLFPQLHGYASLVLAIGIAMQLAVWVRRRAPAMQRAVRLVAAIGGAAVLLTATTLPRLRAAAERRAIAALPHAPPDAPNVVMLILDTVRADYMSLYGAAESTTPNLERWARQGAVFDQAYATSSWTTPSHASLFTGQYPGVHGASFTTRLADEHLTLAELLQSHGWATGGFTANFAATPIESGLAQGFLRYEDLKNSPSEIARSTTITQADNVLRAWTALASGRGIRVALSRFLSSDFEPRLTELAHDSKSAAEVRAQFDGWLDALPPRRPFFAFLNFFDAHAPYAPPAPYDALFRGTPPASGRYRGAIRYLDDQVDSLFRSLERRGLLENTVVVVTSDHGEQWDEHGLTAHANSLYRQVLHVPLVFWYPKAVPAGLRISHPVTGRDVAATILELLAIEPAPAIGGASLASAWRRDRAPLSDVISEVDQNMRPAPMFRNYLGPMKSIIDDSLHVIRDGSGRYEAYRYREDPAELFELVATRGDSATFAARLRQAVTRNDLRWISAVAPSRPRRKAAGPD